MTYTNILTQPKNKKLFRFLATYSICLVVLLLMGLMFGRSHANAQVGPPGPLIKSNGSDIPQYVRDATVAACIRTGFAVAEATWVSIRGSSAALDYTVTTPGEIVPLDYNIGVYQCDPARQTGIFGTFFLPFSGSYQVGGNAPISPPEFNRPTSQIVGVTAPDFGPRAPDQFWSHRAFPFSLNTTGITGNQDVTFNMLASQVNWFPAPTGRICVMTNPPYPTANNEAEMDARCEKTPAGGVIRLRYSSPTVSYDGGEGGAGCNWFDPNQNGINRGVILRGWAFDRDSPQTQLKIHVYVDTLPGQGTGTQHDTGVPRPDVNAAFPETGTANHGFEIDMNAVFAVGSTHVFNIYVRDVNSAGVETGSSRLIRSLSIGPCNDPAVAACGSRTITIPGLPANESTPEVGMPFNLTVTFINSSRRTTLTGATGVLSISGQPDRAIAYSAAIPGGAGTATITGLVIDNPGSYTLSWTYSHPEVGNGRCNSTEPILAARRPYLRVFGGDVVTGSVFGDNCAIPNSGDVKAYAWESGGNWVGAGSQYAVAATNLIEGFTSARRNIGSGPQPPLGLAFGNTSNGNALVGFNQAGRSIGIARCVPDYFEGITDSTPLPPGVELSRDNENKIIDGSSGLGNIGGLPTGPRRRTVYVRGDVFIESNIAYSTVARGTREDIPSFRLIVRGNIYIAPGVTQLDGIYIAQPDNPTSTDSGIIVTCAQRSGANIFSAIPISEHTRCANGLTVNGSFIAKTVQFLRSRGGVGRATASEGVADANIAEVFNFTPELYLGLPTADPVQETSCTTSGVCTFDAIKSLPPVF